MKYSSLLTIFSLSIMLAACKSSSNSTQNNAGQQTEPQTVVECRDIAKGKAPRSAPFTLETAEIRGNCLFTALSYSGGCAEHRFELIWSGAWLKSNPPVAELTLFHDAKGDACRSIQNEEFSWKLAEVAYPNAPEVILRISHAGKTTDISYKP